MQTSELKDFDLYLFHQGTNYHAQELLGAHFMEQDGVRGVRFTVWAPRAEAVSVVGDFNGWNETANPMTRQADGEIWAVFLPGLEAGAAYKYSILPQGSGERLLKADPYALRAEKPPQTASVLYDFPQYQWKDEAWQRKKCERPSYEAPMMIYEVHLGSWRRTLEGNYLSYRDLAEQLVDYAAKMHYTHIELMPLCEHPFDGSWGYQATGYFAVTSRYGSPEDFMYLVDRAHQKGIGIIMDWVPGHFCKDAHGLWHFDGHNLYESDNELRAENRQWGTTNFDYGRTEVQSFLISNALFWLEEYHIDGLRIDAVANMLYLNYGREDGEWQPNKYGNTGNLEAMEFIKRLNTAVFKYQPQALMLAEESTSWPLISRPVHLGGMGFNYKWNMGWMNDMLEYMGIDPLFRKGHQDKLTFSLMYAFSENFVLPLSHDEVVHGKRSLIGRMPGDYWQQFAGLRAFLGYWLAHPGKKLLFMGGEFGQFIEWKYDDSLDWHLVEGYPMHQKMQECSKALNKLYCSTPALWEVDFEWSGFTWIDCKDTDHSVIAFVRWSKKRDSFIVVVCNFTPEERHGYRIGVPRKGTYREVMNTDEAEFGGSGVLNGGDLHSAPVPWHDMEDSLVLTLPPLGVIFLTCEAERPEPQVARPVKEQMTGGQKKKETEKETAAAKKRGAKKKKYFG